MTVRRGRALPRARAALAAAVALGVLAGCVAGATEAADAPAGSPPSAAPSRPAPPEQPPAVDARRVLAEIAAAASGAGGRISAVALDGDGTPLLSSPDAGEPAYTASLVKLLVVARLLALNTAGGLTLAPEDAALMEAAVVASDDAAMSTLWHRHDGPRLVGEVAAQLGLTGTAVPAALSEWGRTTTTATDMATFLAALPSLLEPGDARTLLGWMRSTTATAADGFDQRFGLLAGGTGRMAAKQGWMCCPDDLRHLHSVGVTPDGRVVVLLGRFPESASWEAVAAALDGAATAVLGGIS